MLCQSQPVPLERKAYPEGTEPRWRDALGRRNCPAVAGISRPPLLGLFGAEPCQHRKRPTAGLSGAEGAVISSISPLSARGQGRLSLFLPRPPAPRCLSSASRTQNALYCQKNVLCIPPPPPPAPLLLGELPLSIFFSWIILGFVKGGKGGRAGEGVRTGSWFLIPHAVRRQEEGKGGSQRGASHRLFPSPFPLVRWRTHSPPKAGRRKTRAGRLRLAAATAWLTKPRRVTAERPRAALRDRSPHCHHCLPTSRQLGCGHPSTSRFPSMRNLPGVSYDRCWAASLHPDLPLPPEQPNIWWGLMLISLSGRRVGPPMLPPRSGTRAVV